MLFVNSDFKMTEAFASAMVTVIPIILLLGAVELSSRLKRGHEHMDDVEAGRSQRVDYKLIRGGSLWGALAAAHCYAEISLIEWLATGERQESPHLASFIAVTAALGFVAVVLGAFLQMVSLDKRVRRYQRQVAEADTTPPADGTTSRRDKAASAVTEKVHRVREL